MKTYFDGWNVHIHYFKAVHKLKIMWTKNSEKIKESDRNLLLAK